MREERPFPLKVCLTPAAEEAAERATSWEEFRGRRLFRFVHWFAGTARFGVGEAVVAEASKHGLRAEHISLDRDRDGVDLAADEPAESHLAWAREHKVDGAHAGFPCSTFPRLRFREQPGMPSPVRDLEHMRGLPSNTPAQQKEADVGWLLAARSATFMDAVRSSARERSVQAAAILENPLPSGPPYPSAFFVDAVAAFLQDEESEAAEFSSCIYGMPSWKPARWAGALRGLASLSGRCKCEVPHEQIIGKKASAAAARYPPALCEVYAELVVKAWEETLSKEWEIISQRRRAEGGEQAQALVRVGRFGNVLVRQQLAELSWKGSRAGRFGLSGPPSKKARKEENVKCTGGMRGPARAVKLIPGLRRVGSAVAAEFQSFVKLHPEALEVADNFGQKDFEGSSKELVVKWKRALRDLVGGKGKAEPLNFEQWPCPLEDDIWERWLLKTGDPEKSIGPWARQGVPLGIEVPIDAHGIFPKIEEERGDQAAPDVQEAFMSGFKNYSSFYDDYEGAKKVARSATSAGHGIEVEWSKAMEKDPHGSISKMALIVKSKQDGTVKRRIIMDVRRSGANSKSVCLERIILPRISDAIQDLRQLAEDETQAWQQAAAVEDDLDTWGCEAVSADFSDAYMHWRVDPRERQHC